MISVPGVPKQHNVWVMISWMTSQLAWRPASQALLMGCSPNGKGIVSEDNTHMYAHTYSCTLLKKYAAVNNCLMILSMKGELLSLFFNKVFYLYLVFS